MAVYFKFKSAKDYDSIPIDGHFISVLNLKEKIFESKHLGRGTDFDLVVTNAQTNEEYLDEAALIPKNTSVLIRRVPGRPRKPIVTAPLTELEEPKVENMTEEAETVKSGFVGVESSATKYPDDLEWDEFGHDLYAIPETIPVQSSNPVQEAPPSSKADEESKFKALIDTPALDWQQQPADGFGAGRGYGRGPGGRMMGGRGFGRGGFERKTPPPGYVCHRCKVSGHFIQHCPTNGDPNFDIKRVKPPTGIPKSMLVTTPDGSYALPSGASAVLKPNEAAFEKEVEGMPSTRSVGELPPELHCPLCKEVMKDAVLTSKCCFKSFCDKCIRDYIISKLMCVCGATNILADDLLPNKTLRDTINRILESNNSSEHGGSALQVQDMESARNPQPKVPSPSQSAASKGEKMPPQPLLQKEETSRVQEVIEEVKVEIAPPQPLEKGRSSKVVDISEATHESISVKEPASQGSAPLVDEEVQQKPAVSDAGRKKKKKKARLPLTAAEMQWRASQDIAAENYMMPMGPSYNPYWTGMQQGMEGFVGPYPGQMPYMNYGLGPMDVPFGPMMPPNPFGGPGCMLPPNPFGPPQRDLANIAMGFNAGPPVMSREEFEARKADLKRKRELEMRRERDSKGREFTREVSSSGDISSLKPKSRPPPSSSSDHYYHRRSERSPPNRRSSDPELPRPSSKRKADDRTDHYHREKSHHDDHYHREKSHHDDRDHHRDRDRDHHGPDREHHQRSKLSDGSAKPSSTSSEPPTAASKAALDDKKSKRSVFSRISFPEEEAAAAAASKKQKMSSSNEASASASASHRATSNGHVEDQKALVASRSRKPVAAATDYDSSDDERHFKRRPSRYEPSPPPQQEREREGDKHHPRHSKGSRDREQERDRSGYRSKHR
ncbi:PREDICTED: zinc finger CCCH domain-containing protein 18-like [Ipomoea nil]|uniref:zinc finger CCCH domain-containing protein 18-like n=1 Tax=Ipomoea nil TaxID=35883 RepID=UPI00090168D4|nr:PREDICTED: zinc finger CCCH domain-containing protein 18-like [Ipomoea nil]